MKDFEWQTDEEDLWEDEYEPQEEPVAPKRRWWPGALAVLLVVALVSGLIYRQLNRRVEEAVSSLEEDVIAAFRLVRSSADRRDRELLVSQISGRDARWTSTQKALLDAGLLFDRVPFGLWLQADEPRVISVELAPNLSEAELVAEQLYAIQGEGGVTETVRLQQTFIFRLGERRWLFAPPEQEFWGNYTLLEGKYLTLEVPTRDREIGVRLTADLDQALEQVCTTLAALECPADPSLFVRLETDPESWLDAADPANRLTANNNVILPAPSLLGLPVDEAAYQALWRGYAEHVLSPFIAKQVGYDCCRSHFLFYEALLHYQLNQLGIRPWPMGPAEYEQLARGPIRLGMLSNVWFSSLDDASPEGRVYALAAVDFILQNSTVAEPATLQRSLDTRSSFWGWLQQWFTAGSSDSSSQDVLGRRWLQFVNDHTLSAQRQPPVPLPDQDIAMLCGTDVLLSLYRYDVAAEMWERELDGRFFMSLKALPNDSVAVLEERFLRNLEPMQVGQGKRIVIWDGDQVVVAYEGSMDIGLLNGLHGEHPAGSVLRAFNFLDDNLLTFLSIDLGQCDAAGCTEQVMSGLPIWSPDGQHTIIWGLMEMEMSVVLGDGNGRPIQRLPAPARAYMPFWVDNYTIGYFELDIGEEFGDGLSDPQFVRFVSLDNLESPQTVLSLEDLRRVIPEEEQRASLSFNYIQAAPDDPNTLYVAVNSQDNVRPKVYIFEYKRGVNNNAPPTSSYMELGTATLLISADDSFATFPPFQFSPDGRWLTTVTSGWRHPARLFFLHDRTTGQTRQIESSPSFPHYDWSADSNWLLRVEGGYMSLSAPAHDYHRLLFYDQPECAFPAWVNK